MTSDWVASDGVSLRTVPVREVRALLAGRAVAGSRVDPDYPTADSIDAMTMLLRAHEAMAGTRLTRTPAWWIHQIVLDQTVVGDIGFHGPPPVTGRHEVEIGYVVVPGSRGRGVATAACALVLAQAWRDGADLVRAETGPTNPASRRVLLGNGFRPLGDDTYAIERPAR